MKIMTSLLIGFFAVNQFMIGTISERAGMDSTTHTLQYVMGVRDANAKMIMMPILNEDGVTTHLRSMPTITEVPSEPKTGDVVADAMTVMVAKGTPFYAPENVSFDDPIGALEEWGRYEAAITLSPELEERYQYLIGVFTCNFCCGSPMSVTVIGRCGCAHAKAARSFFRYMLSTYGDTYSNDELVGEAYRWQAIWYPAGVVEDYLLNTGRGDIIGHNPHGGVGNDGMHGTTE